MQRTVASIASVVFLFVTAAPVWASGGSPGLTPDGYAAGAAAAKSSPDKAIAFLKQGNERFVTGKSIRPNTCAERLHQAGTENQGDHAYATVITCSDSRVPVEELFDAGVMDIFVIRVAGNVCDTDEIGSIEYGLAHVNTPVLVVLGHTQCGAVTAVTHAIHGTGHPLDLNIPPLVDNIQPAVKRAMAQHSNVHGDAIIPYAIEENVWQGIEDLFTQSPSTRNLVNSGKAKVVGAIYDVATGHIKWLPEHKPAQILARAESNPNRAMNAMAGGGHEGGAHGEGRTSGHAAARHGDGHAAPAGHGVGARAATTVHAESVTLINPSKLAELDHARLRKIDVAAATMASAEAGMSTLWKIAIGLLAVGVFGGLMLKSGALGRMGVAGKLYAGFTAIVALALVIGGVGYTSLAQVTVQSDLSLATTELDATATQLGALQSEFLRVGIEDKQRGEQMLEAHKVLTEQYHGDFEAIRAFELDEAESAALDVMRQANKKYEIAFAEVVEKFHEIEECKEELDELGEQVDEQLADVLHEHEADLAGMESAGASSTEIALQTELIEKLAACELLAVKVSLEEVEFLLDKKVERVGAMEHELGMLRGTLKTVEELIPLCAKDKSEESADLATLAKVEHELDKYEELLVTVIEDELVVAADLIACTEDLMLIEETATAFSHRTDQQADAIENEAEQTAMTLMGLVAALGSLLAFFIVRGITKPINRIIAGLNEGADQVNDASAQVSSASQQLAEGASEQASSLEETSSALEQMSAMTRTNAENATQANELSEQARKAAQSGDKTTEQLNQSMAAINDASGQISKIIKVIEEIAFQTNLLALNAAVEAARAGEHGKGFAVVADEVRNLAQRAAGASGEITTLIEDSVNKAKEGTQVAGEVGNSLSAIVEDVTKVTELINGIAQASQEQAQGVDQVNTAVSQMDKVTQQNAAGAEESASAAEELSAQAQTVKGMVDELSALVGGKSGGTHPSDAVASRPKRQEHKVNAAHLERVSHPAPAPVGAPAGSHEAASQKTRRGSPDDEFMALDDKGLNEF